MSTKIGTVEIDIKADTSKLVSGMDRAEKTVKGSVDTIKKAIIGMVAAYAGIESVKAFSGMVSDSIAAADATGKLAQKLGFTTKTMSEYQYAAGFAGIETGKFTGGISSLIRRLKNFQETGGGAGKKGFEALGISAEYARKNFKTTDDAFVEILKRLEKMPDGYKKTAAAQDIFSKSSSGMLQLTATDLAKYSEEAQRIGISISQGASNMAAAYSDEMDSLNARLDGVKQTISFSLLPTMNAVSKTALEMFDDMFESAPEDMQAFENIAVTSIGNIAYSVGFIKDAFTGVELVLNTIKIAFYGAGYLISRFIDETITNKINTLIDGYNSLANFTGLDTIDQKLVSSTPEITEKIKELRLESDILVESLMSGRMSADEFMTKFKANLVKVKEEAKEAVKEVSNITDEWKSAIGQLAGTDLSFAGYKPEKIDLGFDVDVVKSAYDLIESDADKINNTFLDMHDNIKGMFDPEQMEAFYKIWNKNINGLSKNSEDTNKTQQDSVNDLGSLYSETTNLMSDFYEEDDKRKHKQLEVDRTINMIKSVARIADLAMVLSVEGSKQTIYGTTALASALTAPFPGNIAAFATVAGMLASIGIAIGGSGGGGTNASSVSVSDLGDNGADFAGVSDVNLSLEDALYELSSKIEIQNKLYESLGDYSKTFQNTLKSSSRDLTLSFTEAWEESFNRSNEVAAKGILGAFDLANLTTTQSMYVDGVKATTTTEYDSTLSMIAALTDFSTAFPELIAIAGNGNLEDIAGFQTELNLALDEYTLSLIDLTEEVVSHRDTWIESFEAITGNTVYTTQALEEAFLDVDILMQKIGVDTIPDLLESLIEVYDIDLEAMKSKFETSTKEEFINYLLSAFPEANFNPEEVYKYIDSIDLVSEAMKVSSANMDEWNYRNETTQQTAERLAREVGFNLAGSMSSLDNIVNNLSSDVDGLTDAELEAVQANDAYLQSILDTRDSLTRELALLKVTDPADNLALQRAYEMADITDETNRLLLLQIYAEEDRQRALEESQRAYEKSLNDQSTALSKYLSDVTSDISILENVFGSLGSVIDSLRGSAIGSSYTLAQYRTSMAETQALSLTDDYDAYQKSLSETISLSSILNNLGAFDGDRGDQAYSQLSAANEFEAMEVTTMSQIDWLEIIAGHSESQLDTLANQLEVLNSQLVATNASNFILQEIDTNGDGVMDTRLISDSSGNLIASEQIKNAADQTTASVNSLTSDAYLSGIRTYTNFTYIYTKTISNYVQYIHGVMHDVLDNLQEQNLQWSQAGISNIAAYQSGGYTPSGAVDKEVGVVHAGEWVAPAWMLESYPDVFGVLEDKRKGKNFPSANNHDYDLVNIQPIVNLQSSQNNQDAIVQELRKTREELEEVKKLLSKGNENTTQMRQDQSETLLLVSNQ